MSTSTKDSRFVQPLRWTENPTALRDIRDQVFIQEQKVPVELEWDEEDITALHFLAFNSAGLAIGCARFLPTGQIGRMAVLKAHRGHHVGEALLLAAIDAAKQQNFSQVWLHAQLHALPFYEKYGFIAEGDIFDDAGIPHRMMRKTI
ncbi:MAG TPA: GNAT family N-acetyltransferase [Pseudomonadales bacterium]|nr:GNAT family N-acetyltransferase [Pseudomonadales bacterium]